MATSAPGQAVVQPSSVTAADDNVAIVHLPESVVRRQLVPARLPSLIPGLVAGSGASGTLTLRWQGAITSHRVRLLRTADGVSVESAPADDGAARFRLAVRVVPAEARSDARVPRSCRLVGDAWVDPQPGGAVSAAAVRNALLRLVPEVAGGLEDAAAQDLHQPRRLVGVLGAAAVAAVVGAVLVSVILRRRKESP